MLIVVTLAVLAQFSWPELAHSHGANSQAGLHLFEEQGEIEFFSGEVAEIASDRIEVVRTALGKTDSRRFSINDETKFEGTAKKGSRVTVGYYENSPDVAARVIVRDGEP